MTPTVSETAPAASATPAVLHIETTPPKARVFVGGTDRGLSPIDVRVDRSSQAVAIEIKRDGYQTLTDSVVPDVDQRMRLTLIPIPVAVGAPPAPRPSASAKGAPYRRFD
jgi:hypothetical protein